MLGKAVQEALILIAVAVAVALAVYAVRPDKIGTRSAQEAPIASPPETARGVSEISLDAAAQRWGTPGVIFADARHPDDYQAGHIRGAVSLYPEDADQWLPSFLAGTDPAAVIITYCDGEGCHLAARLAELLSLNGFETVYYLKDGWRRWQDGGFPTDRDG